MAYNSDGYIMIDFTEVDFRRTNQTIDGLYKRCVDVIGTNKFILVINANGRTPLPATCSFTNNQYVIDTCIYMFAISSNDNLFIRRNDVPASDIIDDSSISVDRTWSSNKIDTELDGKQDKLTPVSPVSINADNEISVDLSGKQDTLTPVSPVSINADNEISVDLSGKQDALTAGDNISIVNNVISASIVKSFTYTGNGQLITDNIVLPNDLRFIIAIGNLYNDGASQSILSNVIIRNVTVLAQVHVTTNTGTSYTNMSCRVRWYDDNIMRLAANNATASCFNESDVVYTVYYI